MCHWWRLIALHFEYTWWLLSNSKWSARRHQWHILAGRTRSYVLSLIGWKQLTCLKPFGGKVASPIRNFWLHNEFTRMPASNIFNIGTYSNLHAQAFKGTRVYRRQLNVGKFWHCILEKNFDWAVRFFFFFYGESVNAATARSSGGQCNGVEYSCSTESTPALLECVVFFFSLVLWILFLVISEVARTHNFFLECQPLGLELLHSRVWHLHKGWPMSRAHICIDRNICREGDWPRLSKAFTPINYNQFKSASNFSQQ